MAANRHAELLQAMGYDLYCPKIVAGLRQAPEQANAQDADFWQTRLGQTLLRYSKGQPIPVPVTRDAESKRALWAQIKALR